MATNAPERLSASPARTDPDDPGLRFVRVNRRGDEPAPERGVVDVAVLDMHHGFLNLGHASIVDTLLDLARQERANLGPGAPRLRVVSFDVRAGLALPEKLAGRYGLVVGTGGPGALDPRLNDGESEFAQGISEDPSWEAPLFRLFDEALSDQEVSLLAICHSYGLLCRWSGAADAVLRPPSKGGKSMGVRTNVLTAAARAHPWFGAWNRVSQESRVQVLDSRLFDLVPAPAKKVGTALAFEVEEGSGRPGVAMTMLELDRDRDGVGPRIWGVNHHPEIGDRGQQRARIDRLEARGDVSHAWVEERRRALEAWNASESNERGLQWTASYTFEGPLRRIVARLLSERRGPVGLVARP